MKKCIEVVDCNGHPTMVPFHRVIRVLKADHITTLLPCVHFVMDGGHTVSIPEGKEAEAAWAAYREWVQSVQ